MFDDSDDTALAEPWTVSAAYILVPVDEPHGDDYGCAAGDTLFLTFNPQ